MVDQRNETVLQQPVFGPNGAVLNSPGMTDEMRSEIQESAKNDRSWRWIVFAVFVSALLNMSSASTQMLIGILLVICAVFLARIKPADLIPEQFVHARLRPRALIDCFDNDRGPRDLAHHLNFPSCPVRRQNRAELFRRKFRPSVGRQSWSTAKETHPSR